MTGPEWALPPDLREMADCGEAAVVQEVLGVFQSDTAERIAAMRAAAVAANRDEIRRQGHALKGSSGQVGALSLAALCKTLEASAMSAAIQELGDLVGRIEREFQEVSRLMARAE